MNESAVFPTEKSKRKRILLSLICVIGGILLLIAARRMPGFAEQYATTVYPVLVGIFARVCNLFPFSVVEVLLYALVLFFFVSLFRKRARRHLTARLLTLAAVLFFLYCANCGVNYYRTPFSEKEHFLVQPSSVEELKALCLYLHEELIAMEKTGQNHAKEANQDQKSEAQSEKGADKRTESVKKADSYWDWMEEARTAMYTLAKEYPSLAGYYPKPKLLLCSWILSVQQVSGIYSPFTIEANVNRDMTAYNIPFTACHELSHLRGFMREDEANFIAFLACLQSDNPTFLRSGLMTGYLYAANALYAEDRELWKELSASLPDSIRAEYAANNAFWDQYDTAVAQVHEAVNDAYLKAHGQKDGVKSYGRVLDLMLAWHRGKKSS